MAWAVTVSYCRQVVHDFNRFGAVQPNTRHDFCSINVSCADLHDELMHHSAVLQPRDPAARRHSAICESRHPAPSMANTPRLRL